MEPFVYEGIAPRIVFGNGAIDQLAAEAASLSISSALIVCSPARRAMAERCAAGLGGVSAGICDASTTNITEAAFERVIAEIGRCGADGFVVLGGGSPIGLGKAVAAATGLPFIAVATTYSGSEMAANWYVGNGAARRGGKTAIALPGTIIYDPALTVGLAPLMSAA
ncbi:MAG: iron-containing alcohol dehydrogenase, partial [Alphaproteobacteria bacterium]